MLIKTKTFAIALKLGRNFKRKRNEIILIDIMQLSIEDLPDEILVEVFKFLEFTEIVDNCLWTCLRW